MSDIWVFVLFFAGWIILQRWILPKLGISTCMSGACQVPAPEKINKKEDKTA